MADGKPKDKPKSKYAEICKGKAKHAGMEERSEQRARIEEESLQNEEINRTDDTFKTIKSSER